MFSFDKRAVYLIIAIIVIFNVVNMGTAGLLSLLLTIPGVIIAISLHEFAHAWMAVRLGDDTPLRQGRLSIDPLKHLDPIGIMMLMFCGIGWGRPVQIDSSNFNPKYRRNGEALVSLAGPVMNFIIAFVLTLIDGLILKFAVASFLSTTLGKVILTMIQSAIIMNIGLGVFNLIPLPPLDGSKIIMPFLPYNAKQWFRNNEQIFYIIFVIIWITGIAGIIISPAISGITSGIMRIIQMIFGF